LVVMELAVSSAVLSPPEAMLGPWHAAQVLLSMGATSALKEDSKEPRGAAGFCGRAGTLESSRIQIPAACGRGRRLRGFIDMYSITELVDWSDRRETSRPTLPLISANQIPHLRRTPVWRAGICCSCTRRRPGEPAAQDLFSISCSAPQRATKACWLLRGPAHNPARSSPDRSRARATAKTPAAPHCLRPDRACGRCTRSGSRTL